MKKFVQFKNLKTGEVKSVKVGWCWTLFLFGGVLGIPLFLRGLKMWGSIMLALWVIVNVGTSIMPASAAELTGSFVGLAVLGLLILFGMKGNEMTAKNYLENDWEFAEPDSELVSMAKQTWGLSI